MTVAEAARDVDGLDSPAVSRRPRRLSRLAGGRGLLNRAVWGIGDQVVSSVTNFAIGLYAAHELPVRDFGGFSLAFITFSFVLNGSRGLSTEPLLVRHSGEPNPAWRAAVAQTSGVALLVGIAAAIPTAVIGLLMGGAVGRSLAALAVCLPALTLQDSWRYAFFAVGQGKKSFVNDSVWAGALVVALVALHHWGGIGAARCMLAWGGTATAGAVLGCWQARLMPSLRGAIDWPRKHRDLCYRYLLENLSISGATQLRYYGLGGIAGLAIVAHVRATDILMAPFLILLTGVGLVALPEAVRMYRRGSRQLRQFCLLIGVGEATASLAWGLVLLAVLPHGVGDLLVGPIWHPASKLLIAATLAAVGACLSAGASTGLHALGAASRSLRGQALQSVCYVAGGLVGAGLGGAQGTVWGVAGATWVGAAYFWWQFHAGLAAASRITDLEGELVQV